MKNLKRVSTLFLAVVMLFCSVLSIPSLTFAASKPKSTYITSLSSIQKGFTVKFKKVKNISGYQIQYSRNSNFKNARSFKVKSSKSQRTVKKLKGGKTYYVRVRTYKTSKGKTRYSSWSKKKSVKTKAPYWCDEGGTHHIINKGIGWYNTYDEATNAALAILSENENFDRFEVQECDCALFTAYVREDVEDTTHEHSWDDGTVTTEPTCQSEGIITYTCSGCGTTMQENIEVVSCSYVKAVIEPTCVDDGYIQYKCS